MIPTRLRVEAAGPDRQGVIDALEAQARDFFGDEEYRLDGPIEFEVETYSIGMTIRRWEGRADYVNWRED